MDSNRRGKGVIRNGYITIKNADYKQWCEFEKTIPFRISYGHLGYHYAMDEKILNISVLTKRSKCWEMVKQWLKDKQIIYDEREGNL